MKSRLKGKKGFTLVEVLIVVTILGILGALILPKLLSNSEKARKAEAVTMLGTIVRLEDDRKSETGSFLALATDATAWATIGFNTTTDATPYSGKYWDYTFITSADTECTSGAAAIATRNATARPADVPASSTIKLCPDRDWKGTYPTKYMPTT